MMTVPAESRSTRPILVVAPSAKLGGSQHVLLALIKELPSHGWAAVPVLLEQGPLRGRIEEIGVEALVLRSHRTREIHRSARTVLSLARIIREQACVLVFSNESKGHVFGGTAAALTRRPAFYWQHGLPSRSTLERAAALIPAKGVITGSNYQARAQRAISTRQTLIRVAPGVNVRALAAFAGQGEVIRTSVGWKPEQPVVGVIGRLVPWKGQHTFLEAAQLLSRARPDVRFLVVGGAPPDQRSYGEGLKAFVHSDPALCSRVHFSGMVAPGEVGAWIDAMDIVANCSVGEPFGTVLLEAMALGKPLVAAASGGPLEIVEDGMSGLFVPPDDPVALANALKRVLGDEELARTLSSGALLRVAGFDERLMARRVAALFVRAIAGSLRRRPPSEEDDTLAR